MSTIIEFSIAFVLSVFGFSEEIPPEPVTTPVMTECCEKEQSSIEISLNQTVQKEDPAMLNLFQKSIKIEHHATKNTLL